MLDQIGRNRFGNINLGGVPAGSIAPNLPPWHPLFIELIEEGVRDLVTYFVHVLDWVTYTSCEGHFYGESCRRPTARHVGILPQNSTQYESILSTINRAIVDYQNEVHPQCILPGVILHKLSDEEITFNVIDLVFDRRSGTPWKYYFENVDLASGIFLSVLSRCK